MEAAKTDTSVKEFMGFCAGILWTDGCYYFSNLEHNGLYVLRTGSQMMEFVTFFPEEKRTQNVLHLKCLRYKDSILFLPAMARHIHIFTPATGAMRAILLKELGQDRTAYASIDSAVLEGDILTVFPLTLEQPVIAVDLSSDTVTVDWTFVRWCRKRLRSEETALFGRAVQRDDGIWMAAHGSDQVVCLNRKKEGDYRVYDLPGTDLYLMFPSAEGFWLCQRKSSDILHWNEKTGQLIRYSADEPLIEEGSEKETDVQYYFNYIYETDEGVFAIPAQTDSFQRLIPSRKRFCSIGALPADFRSHDPNVFLFYGMVREGQELRFYPNFFSQMAVFDMECGSVKTADLKEGQRNYEKEPYRSLWREYIDSNEAVGESVRLVLRDFLNGLLSAREKTEAADE